MTNNKPNENERQTVPPLSIYLCGLVVVVAAIMVVHEGPLRVAGGIIAALQRLVLGD